MHSSLGTFTVYIVCVVFKKILRYKTSDLNTKSLFEANVVLSVARIPYSLFDCDLCFTYINLFCWPALLIMNSVFEVKYFF